MNTPASYTGRITLPGGVENYRFGLNPQNWSANGAGLWGASYLVAEKAPGRSPDTLLLDSRAEVPPQAPEQPDWGNPRPVVFFEDVHILGFRYRNFLKTSFSIAKNGSFKFVYTELDCLTADSVLGSAEGGIDVDYGYATCQPSETQRDAVDIEISKTVRFTEPADLEDEISELSHVLVPLIFDAWLHELIFKP